MVDEGQVNVYGSLATSNPNAIINDFNSLATLSASTSFYIKGDKAVSLAFVSNKAVSCKTNFTVNVEQGMMAHKSKIYTNNLLLLFDIHVYISR